VGTSYAASHHTQRSLETEDKKGEKGGIEKGNNRKTGKSEEANKMSGKCRNGLSYELQGKLKYMRSY
jgi:hypothetical protein